MGSKLLGKYAPVVSCAVVRMILVIAKLNHLYTQSINFVLAFPQAKLDVPVDMEIPAGFFPDSDGRKGMFVFTINKNLCGLKNAALNWFEILSKGLEDCGFSSSEVDPYVFIRDNCIVIVYIDGFIVISRDVKVIQRFIASMKNGKEGFQLTDDGDIKKFLGNEMNYGKEGK